MVISKCGNGTRSNFQKMTSNNTYVCPSVITLKSMNNTFLITAVVVAVPLKRLWNSFHVPPLIVPTSLMQIPCKTDRWHERTHSTSYFLCSVLLNVRVWSFSAARRERWRLCLNVKRTKYVVRTYRGVVTYRVVYGIAAANCRLLKPDLPLH